MNSLSIEMATRFTEWQQGLIWIRTQHQKKSEAEQKAYRSRVMERQDKLLEAISRGCQALGAYMRRELKVAKDDSFTAPTLHRTLIGAEIREPPIELEIELGRLWCQTIRAAHAALPLFWARCFVDWLSEGSINGDLLSSLTLGGRADRHGQSEDVIFERKEAQTRNFLRRLCGIPVVRFNVSVLSDCTLARAWWRFRIAQITADNSEGMVSAQEAHGVLHTNNQAWEELVRLAVRRITVINQPRALAAIVAYFVRNGDFNRKKVKLSAQSLARYSVAYSLEHTPWNELCSWVASTGSLSQAAARTSK